MQKEKVNLQNELTGFEEQMEAMTSHLKNVRQEFSFMQVNRYPQQIHFVTFQITKSNCKPNTGEATTNTYI